MSITVHEIVHRNITNCIKCFKVIEGTREINQNGPNKYACCVEKCDKTYSNQSAAIRHIRVDHGNIFQAITRQKLSNNEASEASDQQLELRIKVDPAEIMEACVDLVAVNALPIAIVEYPAFQKIVKPYILALKAKGIDFNVNRARIKSCLAKKANVTKQRIMEEVKKKC